MRVQSLLATFGLLVVTSFGCVSDDGKIGTPIECKASSDCVKDQWCSQYDVQTHKVFCQKGVVGGQDLGAGCTANTDCKSATCAPVVGTCSALCLSDADCGFGHCAAVDLGDWTSAACFARCQHDADCPEGLVCFLLADATNTHWTTACNKPRATGTAAGTLKGADGCYTYLSTDVAGKTYCGKLCAGAADCTGVGPFTKCSKTSVTNPNEVGSTSIDACGGP